jgi:uncharacterized protein
MYISRHIEGRLQNLSQHFKVILVTGARQVGKSTLLAHMLPGLEHIAFNPVEDTYGAKKDPKLFLQNFLPPVILDEIQYVPELLAFIKLIVDQEKKKGLYYLTGSHNLSILKNVSESLAGRVGVINLGGMTPFELYHQKNSSWIPFYIKDPDKLLTKTKGLLKPDRTLYELIWRGSLPEVMQLPDHVVSDYYSSYVQTYVERDIRFLENSIDLSQFSKFIGITAALTAQEINYMRLGKDTGGISNLTAHKWLNLLKYSYQWRELSAYSGNTIKRISKKTKGYISDTGLACYLHKLSSPSALANHPLFGSLFETFCINMIHNVFSGYMQPRAYHWRSSGGAEVDLILEMDGTLYPIEIKSRSYLTKFDARGIKAFMDTYPTKKIAPGVIIYTGPQYYKLEEYVYAIPWNMLCHE